MKTSLITVLMFSTVLAFVCEAHPATQPVVSGNDMTYMKQQQRDLELFKNQLRGMNTTLPEAQQGQVTQLQNELAAAQGEQNSSVRSRPSAVYFVSMGIPEEGLLPMLQDAQRFGIPATIRGLLENDFRKTALAMFELSKKDKQVGVQIDPTLYQQFGINAVPALVVTCGATFDVLYGSLPLKEALENVAERGECASTARKLLENVR